MRFLLLLLVAIAALCLFFWTRLRGALSDFGLNAFTETLGIIVTILVVDEILKRQEKRRTLPQRATGYEDVRLLTSRIISFWCEVTKSCVPGEAPNSHESLFSSENFEKILNNLHLDSEPNVVPKTTWWIWFPHNLEDHRNLADKILERHNNVLDPIAYLDVHRNATEGVKPEMISIIRNLDVQSGYPRVRNLRSHWLIPEDYGKWILGLIDWCRKQRTELEAEGIPKLKEIADVHSWDAQEVPPCMISQEELNKQLLALHKFKAVEENSGS